VTGALGPAGWAWADVDLDAITHNVHVLREVVAPAAVWAVVKADGYGHGALEVGSAAMLAGADGLCVALASEGVSLRRSGISAPILLLSEQPPDCAEAIVEHHLTPTVSTPGGVAALAAASRAHGAGPLDIHLKIDTGMHRVGVTVADAAALARIIDDEPAVHLAGVFTHLAVADDLSNAETDAQLRRFDDALATLRPVGVVHAANSAGALGHPAARHSLVRIGIAMYGISPGADLDRETERLRPALALKARVSFAKRLRAGDRLSYGLRHTMPVDANVATVPIGYADGVRRNLSGLGAPVLIGGKRREIIGTITMDQLMVDCGDDDVAIGDEVVLIGRQGDELIRAEDWAALLGTSATRSSVASARACRGAICERTPRTE
jgi:alanine racemase